MIDFVNDVILWVIEYWKAILFFSALALAFAWDAGLFDSPTTTTRTVTRLLTPEEHYEIASRKRAQVGHIDAEIALRLKQAELDDTIKFIKDRK
jgi:hypothetical protein